MVNSDVKLTIRQPPHRDFVTHYPGLSGLRAASSPLGGGGQPDRQGSSRLSQSLPVNGSAVSHPKSNATLDAALVGTVEVRVTSTPVQAQWLKIELKKTETVQTSKGLRRYFELIGSQECSLWSAKDKPDADKDGFAPLDTGDFAFSIPIPTGLPPTTVLDRNKNTGIVYHLVATLLHKPRHKSLFGSGVTYKAPTPVAQLSEVLLEKHELNPAWPIYPWQAEQENLSVTQSALTMQLKRETVMYGPGDDMHFTVDIKTDRHAPIKVSKLEITLSETIKVRELSAQELAKQPASDKRKSLKQMNDVVFLKSAIQKVLYTGETTSQTMSAVLPTTHYRHTVQNAKHLDVKYVLKLRATLDVPKEAKLKKGETRPKDEPLKEIVLDNIPVLLSPWSKKHGEWWKVKIGQIPPNLRSPAVASNQTTSTPKPQTPAATSGPETQQPDGSAALRPTISNGIPGSVSAESLATGRRLSSFPPPPIPTPTHSFTGIGTANYAGPYRKNSNPADPRASASQPLSDSGHDYRPEGQRSGPANRSSVYMNGSYPMLAKSMSTGTVNEIYGRPSNANSQSRLASGRALDATPNMLDLSPFGSPQPLQGDEPDHLQRRQSMPPVSSLPVAINRRSETMRLPTAFELDQRKTLSDIGHGDSLWRKGTLSTITGSPPESPVSSLRSLSTSTQPAAVPASVPEEWPSAETEKQRLFRQAKELAASTQQRAGNPVSESPYRSVQGRAGTPLSLTRSFSNPTPRRSPDNGFSMSLNGAIASMRTPVEKLEDMAESEPVSDVGEEVPPSAPSTKEDVTAAPPQQSDQSLIKPSQFEAASVESKLPAHPAAVPRPSTLILDDHKIRYLKALAAREAYQRRVSGGAPMPLSAYEEKQRLQKLYEQEQASRKPDGQAVEPISAIQVLAARLQEHPSDQYSAPSTVYLTPETSYQQAPFFESSPHSSSSHLTSEPSQSSGSYYRDPQIIQGKQRQVSMYSQSDSTADLSSEEPTTLPPSRPPKPRELLEGAYDHLDSPISPMSPTFGQHFFRHSIVGQPTY